MIDNVKEILKIIDECKPLTNGKASPYFLQDHVGPLDDFINKHDVKFKLIEYFTDKIILNEKKKIK
jgi:hypothetical protein